MGSVEASSAPSAMEQEVTTPENEVKSKKSARKVRVRRVTPLPENTLRKMFLKNIFYIDRDQSKFVAVGYFVDHDKHAGMLFKTAKSYVYWSYDAFNSFFVHFDDITSALENSENKYRLSLDGEYEISIRKAFGKFYVCMRDGGRTILLNQSEWTHFLRSLREVQKHLLELFYYEPLIQNFIERVLAGESEDDAVPPEGLPAYLVNRLVDEVLFYKKWIVSKPPPSPLQ